MAWENEMEAMRFSLKSSLLALCAAASIVAAPATKAGVTFIATDGFRDASATFADLGGGVLQVVLTNTSLHDVLVPVHVLTSVFFDIAGDPTLTRTSALLTAGSSVIYDSAPVGGIVGGEWAYLAGLSGAPLGAKQGISSTGLDLFGPGDRFPGDDLAAPESPNGLQYGLVSAVDNALTGNGGVLGSGGLIKNSVTFALGGLPTTFTLADIGNVSFQYGTALTEPNIPAIPEPQTYAMLLAGLGLLGYMTRRRALRLLRA